MTTKRPMNVIHVDRYMGAASDPLVILLDMQKEFIAQGRLLQIETADAALEQAKQVLACARERRLSIAHVRYKHQGNFFNPNLEFSGWIEGFEPKHSEMVFEHDRPSAYSSRAFADMMESGGGRHAVLMGFSGTTTCIATLIEASSRGHSFSYLYDASASHGSSQCDEAQAHESAVHVAAHFCTLMMAQEFVRRHDKANSDTARRTEARNV